VRLSVTDILPQREAVLRSQGFPEGATVKVNIQALLAEALADFSRLAEPKDLLTEVSIAEFAEIFHGEGHNAPDTPLERIFPRAARLALFAVTMGGEVSTRISDCFSRNDFALGAMLDAVASLAATNAVAICEQNFSGGGAQDEDDTGGYAVLSYSPGYCGWHISGQGRLFQFLQPERIGIALNDSFLMTPLKSVTGVLVGGRPEIHLFESNYPFCSSCRDYSCRERLEQLRNR